MSPSARRTAASTLRRVLTVGIALLAVALVAVGGTLVRPEAAPFTPSQSPLVGRTTTVCTTSPATDATATISAVAVRKAPGRGGHADRHRDRLQHTAADGRPAGLRATSSRLPTPRGADG